MRNIHYGFEQLFRRLSKTVSIVFFIDFKSKFGFINCVGNANYHRKEFVSLTFQA